MQKPIQLVSDFGPRSSPSSSSSAVFFGRSIISKSRSCRFRDNAYLIKSRSKFNQNFDIFSVFIREHDSDIYRKEHSLYKLMF